MSEYLMKVMLEKLEKLEERVSELERKQTNDTETKETSTSNNKISLRGWELGDAAARVNLVKAAASSIYGRAAKKDKELAIMYYDRIDGRLKSARTFGSGKYADERILDAIKALSQLAELADYEIVM